jgi:transcriptional regulator with XRE-family HTH domain
MRQSVSDALRRAITGAPVSRYRIARDTGVEQSALSRFVKGRRSLDLTTVDLLADYLGLELVKREDKGKVKR